MLQLEGRASEVVFWRDMYHDMHAHTQTLLSQHTSSALDTPISLTSTRIATAAVHSTVRDQVGAGEQQMRSPAREDMETVQRLQLQQVKNSCTVEDLQREISSLRKTLLVVQQAKVDTELFSGGAQRVETSIHDAW